MSRCPTCYRREDATHRALGRCPGIQPAAPKSRSGYVAPSRRGRQTWAEYNAARVVTPEQKREKARLRQQRRRARMAAA